MKFAQIVGPAAALLLLTTAARATASPVPADTVIQNVNGVQQCVMTYSKRRLKLLDYTDKIE